MRGIKSWSSTAVRPRGSASPWPQELADDEMHDMVCADARPNPGFRWASIEEMENRFLRVVILPDGVTVQNAFFDRSFKL